MRLKGGDFVGKGSYGCTFYPPLGHTSERDKIGKIMSRETAEDEYSYSERFHMADPEDKYGVYGSRPEKVDSRTAIKDAGGEKEIDKCLKDGPTIRDTYQIIMQRATGDLEKLPSRAPSRFITYFFGNKTVKNLFDGLRRYHANNLVHLDIKPQNIVFFSDPGVQQPPKEFKYIDFGLGQSIEEVVTQNESILGQSYHAWPILTSLVFNKIFKIKWFDKTFIENCVKSRLLDQQYAPVLGEDPVTSVKRDFVNLCNTYGIPLPQDNAQYHLQESKIKRALAFATDVSSLSQVLYYLVTQKCGFRYDEKHPRRLWDATHFPPHDPLELEAIGSLIYRMNHFLTKLPVYTSPDEILGRT
jgi:serine/threonine protein kinase